MKKIEIIREFFNKEWEMVEEWEDAAFVTFSALTTSPEESDIAEKKCEKRARAWAEAHGCDEVHRELRHSEDGGDPFDDSVGYIVRR